MSAFGILADPVRRRILELLSQGELSSGEIVDVIEREYGISQSAVSQHLRVLRENGFATVRSDGSRRIYAVETSPLLEIDAWLESFRHFWTHRLESLATEVARGKREREREQPETTIRRKPVTQTASGSEQFPADGRKPPPKRRGRKAG